MRLIHDNAIDRAASLTASTTAGSLVAANLQTDIKSQVWRSTATSATLTATWSAPEVIGGVVLPFCNFTSTATLRVRGYLHTADTDTVFDTGAVYACKYAPLGFFEWGVVPLGANAYQRGGVNSFASGGGAYGRAWLGGQHLVRKIVVDVTDADSADGYIECARLVAGAYWEPAYGAEYGAKTGHRDASRAERSDAGDLVTTRMSRSRAMTFDLSLLNGADRARLLAIARDNGASKPVFVSILPEAENPVDEQLGQIYGKFAPALDASYRFFNAFASSLALEEI